ncbi:hypothetical protein QUF56_13900 [Ureibacillus composti]|nr:hypothetical protein [Ureibacillus composti]
MTGKSYGCSRPGCHKEHKHHDNKNNDCKCECVDALAEALKDNENEFVVVFEKNAIVIGRIDEVRDDRVLVLDIVIAKFAFFGDRVVPFFPIVGVVTFDAYISICEITEFLTIDGPGGAQSMATTLQSQLQA